jgi:hypothetical protein
MTFAVLIWYYLWIVPHLLLAVVLGALIWRKLYRQFPIFSAYLAFELVQFLVLFTMAKLQSVTNLQYALAYSVGLALSIALRFGVIYEISAHLFRNYGVLGRFGKPLFRWIATALLPLGLLFAYASGGHDVTRLVSVLAVLERAASILQCGLLLGMFVFSSYLGLSWRSYVFGIALGLGIFASVELAVSAIRSETGFIYGRSLDYLTMATYHCCVLIWAFYLWAPERSSQYALRVLPQSDVETWNKELQRLMKQ